LREGKAIDGIANVLKAVIVPIEEYLDEQEHYIERKREAEEEARRLEAEKLLKEKEEKEKAEREAEEKRIREENEKLKKEAEKREAEIKKMREELSRHVEKEKVRVTCPKCKHVFFVEDRDGK
jgi:ATPase subunit of ABC transporter with duplicated ATPase domains